MNVPYVYTWSILCAAQACYICLKVGFRSRLRLQLVEIATFSNKKVYRLVYEILNINKFSKLIIFILNCSYFCMVTLVYFISLN